MYNDILISLKEATGTLRVLKVLIVVMLHFVRCRGHWPIAQCISISSSGDPSRVNPSFPSWSENPSLSRLPSLPQDIPTLIIQSQPQKWPTENDNPTMTSTIESCLN